MTPDDLYNQALSHHSTGNLPAAESLYRQLLSLHPNHPGALHHLGLIAHQVGRQDLAQQLITRSLQIQNDPTAWCNLGEVFRVQNQTIKAEDCYRKSLALNASGATAWSNLGLVLREQRRFVEAEQACSRSIEIDPNNYAAWQNLCNAQGDLGIIDKAVESGIRATQLAPQNPTVWSDLGTAQVEKSDLADAITSFETAIALNPTDGSAHQNLAQARLLLGDLQRAWPDYEYRWKTPGFPGEPRHFPQPQWQGDDLGESALLIHAEQGFGDCIQFIRYLPLVAGRTKKIIVEVHRELFSIISRSITQLPMYLRDGATVRVISRGDAIPPFAQQIPMLSLPLVFNTSIESIPCEFPYLKLDDAHLDHWRDYISREPQSFKIGIAWAGRPTHQNDHNRSCRLADFAPLASIPNTRFYVLQKGPAVEQVKETPPGLTLINTSDDLRSFDDTAALISQLDLVISIDTSIVHLAGAIGKEVWLLLPFSCDWRWMKPREHDTPWYPTLRLFRQQTPKSWPQVFTRVARALREHLA